MSDGHPVGPGSTVYLQHSQVAPSSVVDDRSGIFFLLVTGAVALIAFTALALMPSSWKTKSTNIAKPVLKFSACLDVANGGTPVASKCARRKCITSSRSAALPRLPQTYVRGVKLRADLHRPPAARSSASLAALAAGGHNAQDAIYRNAALVDIRVLDLGRGRQGHFENELETSSPENVCCSLRK